MEEQNHTTSIIQIFDETLAKHMASCVVSGPGLPEVPVSLSTISSLVLLAERESEMEMFAHEPPERYTRETFILGLEELGLDVDGTVRGDLDGLISNGLIDIGPEGIFKANPSAMEMAKKVDEAFCGMPAMSLIAYLVQTIDEVLSGRKELAHAVDQLDQTLARCENGINGSKDDARVGARTSSAPKGPSAEAIKAALSASLRRRQTEQNRKETSSNQPKIVTAGGEVVPLAVHTLSLQKGQKTEGEIVKEVESEETALEKEAGPQGAPTERETEYGSRGHDDSLATQVEENPEEVLLEVDTDFPAVAGPDNCLHGPEVPKKDFFSRPADTMDPSLSMAGDTTLKEMPAQLPAENGSPKVQKHRLPPDDDALEEKIAAFEQQLAMTCPVCGSGRIEQQETGKGKTYYRCSSEKCVFVSWGKPYHQACPACKNPFLIEAAGEGGKTFLKCPRATCRYSQPLPGENYGADTPPTASSQGASHGLGRCVSGSPPRKRRVVRRRVVRRKK